MKLFTYAAMVCAVVTCPRVTLSQSIVQVVSLPSSTYFNAAWGLTADAMYIYLSSNTSDTTQGRKVYKLDFNGARIDSVLLPRGIVGSQGLARDDSGNFYFLRRYTAVGTIMKFSPAGALVDSMRLPSSKFPGGLAWDGSHIWYSIYSPDAEAGLYKVNWTTKQVVDTILVPTKQPYGITWDGTYLYYVENGFQSDAQGIYKVNPAIGDTAGFVAAPVDPSGTRPLDAAWDGRYMWLLAEPVGANTGRALYKYDLSGGGTPDIHFSRDSVDLGYRRIGGTHTDSILVQNVGTASLRIDSLVTPLSVLWASFASPLPLTLQPGASEKFYITSEPSGFVSYRATFEIVSNDPDERRKNFSAKGFGIYSDAYLHCDTSHDFGARRVGSSSSWNLTLQNRGAERLSVTAIDFTIGAFAPEQMSFPLELDSLQAATVRIRFSPVDPGLLSGALQIISNASNGSPRMVVFSGNGNPTTIPLGQPLWTYAVPNNPRTSSNSKLMKGLRSIGDINGDGKADVVVSAENYWTMALNGNASVDNDTLWAFNTYIANYSAGSIGTTGDYSHQKALAVADLNRDNFNDVVIGTGGGNEHVYALNGRNGQILWQFGTDHPDSFSLGDFTGVDAATDFNGDGIPDVIAAAAATETGGIGGRRLIYQFDGATGQVRWTAPLPGFTHAVASLGDISGDGVPDVVGCVGQPSYRASAFNGATGNLLWDFTVASSTGGGKEAIPWPVAGQSPDVIVGAFWGPIYRVDGASGTQMWSCPTGGNGVMQLVRLKDVTGDGVDEIVAPLLLGGAYCVNGANGSIVWSLPTGSTMGVVVVPDVDRDGYDDVALAVQNQGVMIVRGQDGALLALYSTGTQQAREVAIVSDVDGNTTFEILFGGQQGNVGLLSGGALGPDAVGETKTIPGNYELGQNFPNPFNPVTTIRMSIPVQSDVSITIYDLTGREIRRFRFERVPAGTHSVVWDGTNSHGLGVASGVYLYTMQVSLFAATRKLLLVR